MTSAQSQHRTGIRAWLAGIIVALALTGAGLYIYWTLRTGADVDSSPAVVTLTPEEEAKSPSLETAPARTGRSFRRQPSPLPLGQDPGPTLVTLKLQDATAANAISELATASGFRIATIPGDFWRTLSLGKVTLNANRQSFWPTLMEICRQSRMYPQAGMASHPDNRESIMLGAARGAENNYPAAHSGSFLLTLNQVNSNFSVQLDTLTQHRIVFLQMTLFAEPKFSLFQASYMAAVEEAVDDLGNSLIDDRNTRFFGGGPPQSAWCAQMNAQLPLPAKPGQRITRLKGYVPVTVGGNLKEVAFDSVLSAQDVHADVGPVQVQFRQLRRAGNGYSAVLSISNPRANEFGMRQTVYSRGVRLVDAQGKDFRRVVSGEFGIGDGAAPSLTVQFLPAPGVGDPAKLIVAIPTELNEIRIPFEFKNLPIP